MAKSLVLDLVQNLASLFANHVLNITCLVAWLSHVSVLWTNWKLAYSTLWDLSFNESCLQQRACAHGKPPQAPVTASPLEQMLGEPFCCAAGPLCPPWVGKSV